MNTLAPPHRLEQPQVDAQFLEMTAGLSLPEQTYLGNVDGAFDAYLAAMGNQNLTLEAHSLDNKQAAAALHTTKGLEAIAAPSLAVDHFESLGYAAFALMQNEMARNLLNSLDDDLDGDTDPRMKKKRRKGNFALVA